jgi:hypothetical protein
MDYWGDANAFGVTKAAVGWGQVNGRPRKGKSFKKRTEVSSKSMLPPARKIHRMFSENPS